MSEQALRKHLEFYRDLGFEELFLGSSDAEFESVPEDPDPDGATSAEVPVERAPAPAVSSDESLAPAPPASDAGSEQQPSPLQVIQEDIGDCTRCRLHQGRKTIVFGSGNPNAKLVFIGEGPGADEDAQGLPFVGRAGQLLTRMIDGTCERIGLPIRRPDVYICNAICVLGGTAAKALLRPGVGIMKLRGNWTEWGGIRVMPTYHPAYLLRGYNPEGKRQAFEDLKEVFTYVYK